MSGGISGHSAKVVTQRGMQERGRGPSDLCSLRTWTVRGASFLCLYGMGKIELLTNVDIQAAGRVYLPGLLSFLEIAASRGRLHGADTHSPHPARLRWAQHRLSRPRPKGAPRRGRRALTVLCYNQGSGRGGALLRRTDDQEGQESPRNSNEIVSSMRARVKGLIPGFSWIFLDARPTPACKYLIFKLMPRPPIRVAHYNDA